MKNEIRIGQVFYKDKNGEIVKPYGVDQNNIFYTTKDNGHSIIPKTEFDEWTLIDGMKDFENSNNPMLPYSFDLNWDIKYLDNLKEVIVYEEEDEDLLKNIIYEKQLLNSKDKLNKNEQTILDYYEKLTPLTHNPKSKIVN